METLMPAKTLPVAPKPHSTPITPEEVVTMYGMDLEEATFFAGIMNGKFKSDVVKEPDPEPA